MAPAILLVLGIMVTVGLLVVVIGLLHHCDRRRPHVLAERLLAEQRMDAATRATLQAMRDAARAHIAHRPDGGRR